MRKSSLKQRARLWTARCPDRKSTRLNSSHRCISYAAFCLKKRGRDHWWHDLMAHASDACPAEPLDAEHPLELLDTAGTTEKPKGSLHTTCFFKVGAYPTTKCFSHPEAYPV